MNVSEYEACMAYGKCPKCEGKLSRIISGLLFKDYTITCLKCNGKWDKYIDFKKDVDNNFANEFLNSEDYVLLKNFAKSNVDTELDVEGFEKLSSLLKFKGYKLSSELMMNIFTYELYQEKIRRLKRKIGYIDGMTIDEIINHFVKEIPVSVENLVSLFNVTFSQNFHTPYLIASENGDKIEIRSKRQLKRKDQNLLTKQYEKIGLIFIDDKNDPRWELPMISRVRLHYDINNYDLLRMIIDELKISYDENVVANKIYQLMKKKQLEKFEKKLLSNYRSIEISDLDNMNGFEFEVFLVELYTKMGYHVEKLKSSQDQGSDLLLKKYDEKIAVQAKRYNQKVTNKAIQEIVASLKYYKADKGMVVTTSDFTSSAIELAHANNIELVNRDKLIKLFKEYY